MIHPSSELRFISADIGYGVFATQFIPRGTFLWVLDAFDRILTAAERDALPPLLRQQVDRYAYQAADGDYVFCWDFGRYMNHSCAPASRGVGDAFEIAVRDVHAGEELTCEYGTLNLVEALPCRCGALGCRGVIRRDDAERYYARWDAEARAAFRIASEVPQPLLPYAKVGPRDLPLLAALHTGAEAEVPSARGYHVPASEAQPR